MIYVLSGGKVDVKKRQNCPRNPTNFKDSLLQRIQTKKDKRSNAFNDRETYTLKMFRWRRIL